MFSQEQHCQGLLQTYTGERIKVLGEMQVQVKYGKQRKPLVLVVVDGTGSGLFGRNWLEQLRLDWKRIGAIEVCQSLQGLTEVFLSLGTKDIYGVLCPPPDIPGV